MKNTINYHNIHHLNQSNHDVSSDKIDIAIKQLEQELTTLKTMSPVDYVVNICIEKNYRLAYVYYLKYRFLMVNQLHEQAHEWLSKTIEQSKLENNHDLHIKSLLAQGEMEYEREEYSNATKLWMECLEYAVKRGDTEITSQIIMNVGKVYFVINDYNTAQKHYQRSWEIAIKTNNNILKAAICIHMAVNYLESKDESHALKYMYDGEKYMEGLTENSSLYSDLIINLSKIKVSLGKNEEAISDLNNLYKFNKINNLQWQTMLCEINLGLIYYNDKHYDNANIWFDLGLISAKHMKKKHMEMKVYKWLYATSVAQKDHEKALTYYNEYNVLYEQLFKVEEKIEINLFDKDVQNLLLRCKTLLIEDKFIKD